MQPRTQSRIRLLIVPLLIIVVGMGVSYVSQKKQREAIETTRMQVWTLISMMNDSDDTSPICERAESWFESGFVCEAVERHVAPVSEAPRLNVFVQPGDLDPPYGNGNATHIVSIRDDQHDVIRLRTAYSESHGKMVKILGYILPQGPAQPLSPRERTDQSPP